MNDSCLIKEKSDTELVELAKQDPQYFGHLMQRYQQPLFRYIYRLSLLPNEDVEDLLQEIFLKIYRKLNEYPPILKFSSWIYRLAHNHLVDHFRKINARPRITDLPDDEWLKIIGSDINLEKEIIHKDCVEKIKSCISELPFKYKEVLILRFLEQKDYEEIMDILKKPKGSVATLINRGKDLLKKKMKENHIECY